MYRAMLQNLHSILFDNFEAMIDFIGRRDVYFLQRENNRQSNV